MVNKQMKKEALYAIITGGIVIIILYLFFFGTHFEDKIDRTECPYKIEGNLQSDFIIQYFDSPYCVWCWLEEPVLRKLVKTKGDSLQLERYDIRYCTALVSRYKFSGTPSFVFSMRNETKEYLHMGYIKKKDFFNLVCEVTGDC